MKVGMPPFARGGDKQGGGAAHADELKELRVQLAGLKRKATSLASASAPGQRDDDMCEEAEGPSIAQLVAAKEACATVLGEGSAQVRGLELRRRGPRAT